MIKIFRSGMAPEAAIMSNGQNADGIRVVIGGDEFEVRPTKHGLRIQNTDGVVVVAPRAANCVFVRPETPSA